VVDSSGALDFTAAPEKLGVIGAGVIGLELGSVWHRLGSQVVLLEAMETFCPAPTNRSPTPRSRRCRARASTFAWVRACCPPKSAKKDSKDGVQVSYENSEGKHSIEFSKLVVAVGRKPNTQGLDVNEVGLLLDERGYIHVDEFCRTNLPNIYAVGDVVRGPMLAHKASEEGIMVVERIAGEQTRVNYDAIPWVIYTSPEIAWVGKTERQCAPRPATTRSASSRYPPTAARAPWATPSA
jgi:dihydrolipoamide dehydrogenase